MYNINKLFCKLKYLAYIKTMARQENVVWNFRNEHISLITHKTDVRRPLNIYFF